MTRDKVKNIGLRYDAQKLVLRVNNRESRNSINITPPSLMRSFVPVRSLIR